MTLKPLVLIYIACLFGFTGQPLLAADRWYTDQQVSEGKALFAQHCAACHGTNAQATPDWRKRNADNSFPPPPLNGTAHTWHHPMNILQYTILNGGAPVGGKMPPFRDRLKLQEIDSIIAWFQSLWRDEIYDLWLQRHK